MIDERHEGETDDAYCKRINREARDQYRLLYPGSWVQQWMRDPSFWRDVASRTLSALIVGVVIFIVAAVAGFVKPFMLAGVVTPLVLFLGLILSVYAIEPERTTIATGRTVSAKRAWLAIWRIVLLVVTVLIVVWGSAWLLSLIWY